MNSAVLESSSRSAALSTPQTLRYALVTPARNEADLIEQTIRSVVAQTVPPAKWVIVSDGSTDGTDEIVKRYASQYSWIELVRMPERRDRQFAAKAHAFNAGCARLEDVPFDIIGNLELHSWRTMIGRISIPMRISSPMRRTSRVPASCSARNASRRWAGIFR